MNYQDNVNPKSPDCPWNQKDAEMTEWEESEIGTCCCCDTEEVPVDENETCEECFIPEEIEEDEE